MSRSITHASIAAGAVMVIGIGATSGDFAWANDDDNDKLPLYLTRTLDATAIRPVTNDMYSGSGNTVANFLIKRNLDDDLEIAIKAKYRQGNDIRPTYVDWRGRVHIDVPAGPQVVDPAHGVPSANPNRAAWSWDYSISSAINGSTRPLSAFKCTMRIDLDPSKAENYLTLKLAKLGPPSGSANGFGWKWVNTPVIPDDAGTPDDAGAPQVQVTQNSQNYAFYATQIPPFPYAFGEGQFDLELSCDKPHGHYTSKAFKSWGHSSNGTSVHVVFNVTATPAP